MKQSLSQIVIFFHVIDLMSFSKAALRLGCSKAYVSKQISMLEETLGAKLIERSTRRIEPTFAGTQLFEHSRKIVLEFNNAEQTIAALQDKPKGLLLVTAPTAFAAHILAPAVPEFLKSYPEISLDMKLTGQELNLLKEKIDVAIRLTHQPPEDRVAKLIGHYQLQVCATPRYLQKHADLKHPQQLAEHPCLVYATQKVSERWLFIIDGKEVPIYVSPRLESNTYEVLLDAVLSDCGIACLPSYVIQTSLAENKLEILFSDFMPPAIPIYAVYAQNINLPPMTRVFIEFLEGLLK